MPGHGADHEDEQPRGRIGIQPGEKSHAVASMRERGEGVRTAVPLSASHSIIALPMNLPILLTECLDSKRRRREGGQKARLIAHAMLKLPDQQGSEAIRVEAPAEIALLVQTPVWTRTIIFISADVRCCCRWSGQGTVAALNRQRPERSRRRFDPSSLRQVARVYSPAWSSQSYTEDREWRGVEDFMRRGLVVRAGLANSFASASIRACRSLVVLASRSSASAPMTARA